VLQLILAAFLLGAPLQLSAGDPPTVSFVSHGPLGMKIEGASHTVTVIEEKESVLFTLPLATLQTGIELRDKHMHEALESEAFPLATLRVQRSALPALAADTEVQIDLPAELSLHGQTKPIVLHAKLRRAGALEAHAEWQLDLTAFGIKPPSYLGVKVKPEVEVAVSLRLTDGGSAK
jgi:polyisoprenoid-binding protein YceI